MSLRTAKTIAACQRLTGVTKKAHALLNHEESNAVSVDAGWISFHAQSIHPIALSAHIVPRTSLKFVAGVIEFFNGIASVKFDLGRFIQSPK